MCVLSHAGKCPAQFLTTRTRLCTELTQADSTVLLAMCQGQLPQPVQAWLRHGVQACMTQPWVETVRTFLPTHCLKTWPMYCPGQVAPVCLPAVCASTGRTAVYMLLFKSWVVRNTPANCKVTQFKNCLPRPSLKYPPSFTPRTIAPAQQHHHHPCQCPHSPQKARQAVSRPGGGALPVATCSLL